MDIIVCVKSVPFTQEVDLLIDESRKDVEKDMLPYVINEWDNYAMEEALVIKEKMGGTVGAITIGNQEDEKVLRRCLAMGADRAIRVDPGPDHMDGFIISRVLAEVVKDLEFDLILTGVQADDDNKGIIGPMLAEQLGIARAAVVTSILIEGDKATIKTELEGGTNEVSIISLPALMTIQTGINKPRYVSMMAVRKAGKKKLDVISLEKLNLSQNDLAQRVITEELFLPPETEGTQFIEGEPEQVAEQLIQIIKEKGGSI